ncbi:hypothetical protein SAMN06296952_1106 [Oscillospiraceae bacterium]|nr:hypothetical protein SAMN06296952_1106 [Oscillospiraceae bacterium]
MIKKICSAVILISIMSCFLGCSNLTQSRTSSFEFAVYDLSEDVRAVDLVPNSKTYTIRVYVYTDSLAIPQDELADLIEDLAVEQGLCDSEQCNVEIVDLREYLNSRET